MTARPAERRCVDCCFFESEGVDECVANTGHTYVALENETMNANETDILAMWLTDNAKGRRHEERRCRKAAAPTKSDTQYSRNILALADAHAKAAKVYEDALAAVKP